MSRERRPRSAGKSMRTTNSGPTSVDTLQCESYGLRCGTLIDGKSDTALHDMWVRVSHGRIESIERWTAHEATRDTPVLDASRYTVMPGLIDVHVHLALVVDPIDPFSILPLLSANAAVLALHAANYAAELVGAGFTTVRDLAGITNRVNTEVVALRDAIGAGLLQGPRIFAAGWVSQTAGHIDMITSSAVGCKATLTADGPMEVRAAARHCIREGVDLLKTSSSGSFGPHEQPSWRNYTLAELQALADEAQAVGKLLAVHADSAQGVKNAVHAGATTIEHATFADEEAIDLIVERGMYLVPTLTLSSDRTISGLEPAGARAQRVIDQLLVMQEAAQRTFQLATRAGVKIACGSDIYRLMPQLRGRNAHELQLMVQNGMSAMNAIKSATSVAAQALGAAHDLGALEPGLRADFIIVDGNPLTDIALLEDPNRLLLVAKDGQIVVERWHEVSHSAVRA